MVHRILIVVDMQHDFIDGVLGTNEAKAIVSNVEKLINDIDKEKDYLYFTIDYHNKIYYPMTIEGQRIPFHCGNNTEGFKNVVKPELFKKANLIHYKTTFGTNDLKAPIFKAMYHQKRNENFVIELCGVCTDICVISYALFLRSQFPKVPIIVHKDACAGTTPELHEAALKVMQSCLIDIV